MPSRAPTPVSSASRWSSRARSLVLVLLWLPAFAPPAAAQEEAPSDIPGVSLDPANRGDDDPNDGQWFVADAEPGTTTTLRARLQNLADVEQQVELYTVAMTVNDDDEAALGRPDEGVGTWGHFDEPTLVLPPSGDVIVPFTVSVPADAEPGDHIGAVVVESAPYQQGSLAVLKRTASRLYVTVPGDASPGIEIESVDLDHDPTLLARKATVTVSVRNTGNVRLAPTVTVGGEIASGSTLLMSRSAERYVVTRSVPLWGGPQSWPVEVATTTVDGGSGPAASATATRWVVPWWVLLALFLVVVGFFTVRELRRRLT
jgi:hypothetical protein